LFDEIQSIVAPNLRELRSTYGEFAEKRGEVREALAIYGALKDLEERKTKLEAEVDGGAASSAATDTELSTTVVDQFAALVLDILKFWHFPQVERVHFDKSARLGHQ
jgi:hypothetical protein